MRGSITPRPSGLAAPATRVEPEEYDISLIATDRNRYRTNTASFAANLAAAFSSLGIRATVSPNGVSMASDDITTNPAEPLGLTRWTARVNVQTPTTQTLLHRAMARAAWHASTWERLNVGGLSDATWSPVTKSDADGGASFVSGMDFGIEAAGHGQPGRGTAGGSPSEQRAAHELNALAQRIALLDATGRPLVHPEVRRLQAAMGMLDPTTDGRYTEDTKARMRYLGIASPASSFRVGTPSPSPDPSRPAAPVTQVLPLALGLGTLALAAWYFSS